MPPQPRHHARSRLLAVFTFTVGPMLLSACADSDAPVSGLAAWSVDATPIVSITGDNANGEPLIGAAEGVTRLPNGDVLVADRGLFALRWFDAEGTLVRSVGREGKGPNEFEYIARLHRCGDSVFVNEIAKPQPWLVFSLDGSLARTFSFDSPQKISTYRTACNAKQQFVHMGWEGPRELEPGRRRGVVPYWISGASGAATVALGDLPGSERLVTPNGSRPYPLGREPLLAIGYARAYVGTADSFTVRVFSLTGEPLPSLRYDDIDLRTTADDIERYKFLDTAGVTDRRKQNAEREWTTFEFPPTVPAYDMMLVDARDMVWLRRTPRRIGAEAEWIVFAPDGAPAARLTLPDALRVHEVGDDYVAGILFNPAMGTQAVQVYALRREARTRDDFKVGIVNPSIERGSDGVERLRFTAADFAKVPQFTIDTAPLAVAGGANGGRDFDLTYAQTVHLLSDNRLVTFSPIGAQLLIFGADGSEERVIGRVGRGPGEFMRPGGVAVLPGDTLFLSDVPNNRLNWVLPDGQFVRTSAMKWSRMSGRVERMAGVLPDGRVVLHSAGLVASSESDTVFRSMASVRVQPMQGADVEVVRVPDLAEQTVQMPMSFRGRLEKNNAVLRFTPRATILLWDSLITTTSGDSYHITMRAPSGTVLRELSIALQRRPVTSAMKARALDAELRRIDASMSEGGGDTFTKDERKQMARLTPSADSVPLVVGLYTSPDGTLWVVDNAAVSGTEATVATAFRKDGAMLGRLTLPAGARPVAFGADRVVLRVLDDDDAVELRVHRLVLNPVSASRK